ncbi:hypothetical protein P7K49_001209 [Saguinus oedipus]|uniref:Uncharacterized protein n=1 Tax=Saguinus oedipus TaxID=9490 RepID=A0ABQ9WDX0_SAGOE|nr:hypothetical protein P7K49_001209 [Saguinus oedipus]
MGSTEHLPPPFPDYSKMSRSGKGGLEAQGHLHLTLLTGSQLVTVPQSSHAERKLPQSMGGCWDHRLQCSWQGCDGNSGFAEQQICRLERH